MNFRLLAAAIAAALALSLTACSGGGGGANVRPNPSPAQPGTTSNPAPPPVTYTYPEYNHLVPTGALAAQQGTACDGHGCTGAGVDVGILDSGVDPSLADLQGRISGFKSYITGGSQSPNDTFGHGSVIAQILGGNAVSGFPGGVAPDANLYIAQIASSETNYLGYDVQAFTDLIGQGVRIFNMSYGPTDDVTTATDGPFLANTFNPLIQSSDGLFVVAAMNQGNTQPSSLAGLPYTDPAALNNWIAVVNVNIDSTGQPDGLYTGSIAPSNACGVAALWCISAPGEVQYLPVPNTTYGGLGYGTSFATAVVSGVAALESQAYPWMTGPNLQDTILTTATPLGTGPYPNATYGWGEVNAVAAVNGPAQFAFGAFNADIGSDSSTFSNAIGGSGSLDLTGTTGTLTLTGANTYTGGTSVASGNLWLSGSVASNVTISGGSFGGPGTVHGNVTNTGGTLISQAAVGGQGLDITGNYTADTSSTTAIALGNPLTVDGSASLAGILEILAPATTYTPKSTETLMHYGSETGSFGSQTYGAGVYWTVSNLTYGSTALSASVTASNVAQASALLPGASAVTLATAQGVQASLQQADGWNTAQRAAAPGFLANVAQFMLARTAAQANVSLASLSGEIYGTTRALEVQQALDTDQTLADRVDALGEGTRPGVWLQAMGGSGTSKQTGTATAHDNLGGVMAGVDVPVAPHIQIGAALGRSRLDATLDGLAGRIDGALDTVAVYGRAGRAQGVYLSGRASEGRLTANIERTALLGNSLQSLASNRTDTITAGTLELGDTLGHWTPYADLTGIRLHQAAFTEAGAQGFGLTAPAQSHTASYATLGLRYGTGFDGALGRSSLQAWLAWQRLLSGANLGFEAAFAGTPTATFTAQGQDLARNTLEGGVDLDTHFNRTWSGFIDLGVARARGSNVSTLANIGIEARF
ncbi:MAG: S8 family serine peptidase [Solirubrobacteraceae bacterium]